MCKSKEGSIVMELMVFG